MTEAEIKAEMRLWALECIVSQWCASLLLQMPEQAAETMHRTLLEASKKNTFSKVDPALSDLYSAEFEAATRRLVKMQQGYMEDGRKGL